jgi:hypothetical protein
MTNNKNKRALPQVTVAFATNEDAGQLTEAQVAGMICNPIYAGMGPYPALVSDEEWVRTAATMIQKEGAEQYLVNMLHMLHQS